MIASHEAINPMAAMQEKTARPRGARVVNIDLTDQSKSCRFHSLNFRCIWSEVVISGKSIVKDL